jgi:hypothetical protein
MKELLANGFKRTRKGLNGEDDDDGKWKSRRKQERGDDSESDYDSDDMRNLRLEEAVQVSDDEDAEDKAFKERQAQRFAMKDRGEGLSTLTPRVNDSSALNRVLRESARQSLERQLLRRRLEEKGLRENEIDGDGNCQFRAIADQLYSSSDRYAEVRTDIVEHLRLNAPLYSGFVHDIPYDAYIENMGRDGTWGDHVTLQAASNLYGLEIRVYTSYDENWERVIRPTDGGNIRGVIQLSFYAELHYNSVYPNTDDIRNLRPEEAVQVSDDEDESAKAFKERQAQRFAMKNASGYAQEPGFLRGEEYELNLCLSRIRRGITLVLRHILITGTILVVYI